MFLVGLLLFGFLTRSFGSVAFFDSFGFSADVYFDRTVYVNGSPGSAGDYQPESGILTFEYPDGGAIQLDDYNENIGWYLDADNWVYITTVNYFYLQNITYYDQGGGDGGGGGGGGGTPTVSFTSSTTSAQVGQTITFHVSANCGWGLNEIGLEGCNSAGVAEVNLGLIGVSGISGDNTFSWYTAEPGTFYFDSYGWNSDRSQLTRTAVITVTVTGNGGGTPTASFTPSTTFAQVGQTITFHVSGNSAGGLNEIGLEGCNSAGIAEVNLGLISANGSSADHEFSWHALEAGTYYFDSYTWNYDRSQLIRAAVIAVIVSGGGGGYETPDNPSNVVVEPDEGSAFLSWTKPPQNGFAASVVVWSTDGDFNAAFNDPSRRIETTDRFLVVEGLNNNTPYNFWVLSRTVGGVYMAASPPITVTTATPPGYRFPINDALADITPEEQALVEKVLSDFERALKQQSSSVGWSLSAVLRSLNSNLALLANVLQWNVYVHGIARHIGVRIAREAYLNGEITAEQYIEIANFILSSLNLPPVGAADGEAKHNIELAIAAALSQVASKKVENASWERSPTAVHRFGNSPDNPIPSERRVRKARPEDFGYPEGSPGSVIVGPQGPPMPDGASAYGDINATPINRWYWTLPAGTVLPPVLGIVADGEDVNPSSSRRRTHHTIYPKVPMTLDVFNDLMRSLAWDKTARFKL